MNTIVEYFEDVGGAIPTKISRCDKYINTLAWELLAIQTWLVNYPCGEIRIKQEETKNEPQ